MVTAKTRKNVIVNSIYHLNIWEKVNDAPFVILNTYLSKYKNWYATENKNQWHEYFEDSYFYDNIFCNTPQRDQGTDDVQQAHSRNNFLNYPESNSSSQFGGNRKAIPKTNYKKHGKYDVVINDVKLKMRVIWKHNRQFYIKRRDGSFERINKKSIHS